MRQKIWQQDDAAPDAETLHQAWLRLFSEALVTKAATEVRDHGDGVEYCFADGRVAFASFPGNSSIEIEIKGLRYVSIDLETTGLDPATCQTLEIAIIADFIGNKAPISTLPRLHCLVNHQRLFIQKGAYVMNKQRIERLLMPDGLFPTKIPMVEAAQVPYQVESFLRSQGFDLGRGITVAGKNPNFDIGFLKALGVNLKFQHRFLDPTMLYFDPVLDKEVLPGLKDCCKRADIDTTNLHNAVDDAEMIIALIRNKYRDFPGTKP